MKTAINKKQLCLLLFTIITASKFLVLPTVYAYLVNQDTWIAGLINCLLDGALLAVMLLFVKKFDGTTFFDALKSNLGEKLAKTVYFIYFIYFLLKAVVPVFEQKMFTEITLYETSPTILTFLPFFLVSFYFCIKGMNTMARSGEIIFWFTLIGLSLVFFLSIGTTDFYLLRPILKSPAKHMLTASYSGIIWYGQPIIIMFLTGKIKKEKGFFTSVILTCGIAFFVCVFMYMIFIGIYGDIAVRQIYAMTKMTKYAIALSNVGRFDYIASLMLVVSSVLSLSVPLLFATHCLNKAISCKREWITALIINGALALVTTIFELQFQTILDIFERYFAPVMILLVYLIPPFFLLMKKEKKNA